MQLSKNFSLAEMLESQTARRHNIIEQFNPPADAITNLKLLCIHILQPLSDAIGLPIHISSGYRCLKVNRLVGSKDNSQHPLGEAADTECPSMSNAALFHKIQELKLPFDQLIWEFGTNQEPAWVHVSYSSRNRRQILYIGV
jgi:zinc D-Ala-D-Ala carboxypeptidase